ncbi:phosphonate C-P lyase system protein PhnH [Pseudalkalibacillus decolorationis]|uniref:phosphonate C-P lyase system protein PhnH n=1 Tax=Pseudalkalibacillus decolorationis TaxID=163879 RepID=UPI002148AD94|nr:phosphonate C-P lyase system protein PhnH [Pseudalkalibacillus decolorationis]
MQLDLVHDVQSAYRMLIDSMSRPGMISNLSEEARKVDFQTECSNSLIVIALTLLDTEVTFKVISEHEAEVTQFINQLTYAKSTTADQADYIFILQDATDEQLQKTIQMAKHGDLVNPQESATLIIEVDEVTAGRELMLRGPGIRTEEYVHISATGDWIDLRAEKNGDFPLGIDLLFIDLNHNLLAIPRTTQVMKQVIK